MGNSGGPEGDVTRGGCEARPVKGIPAEKVEPSHSGYQAEGRRRSG